MRVSGATIYNCRRAGDYAGAIDNLPLRISSLATNITGGCTNGERGKTRALTPVIFASGAVPLRRISHNSERYQHWQLALSGMEQGVVQVRAVPIPTETTARPGGSVNIWATA